ncbi:PDZ domain-containing protein [Actinospongicola halichondriae]|uniref:PDZ domain-containing protein n=1 Tax=Actinospongicola halichondriae TaxID=3236844 RepID=UPI003D4B87AC
MSTEEAMVPADAGDAGTPTIQRRRLWPWWLAGGALVALAAAVLAALTVHVPYYEFRPGSARPVAGLVTSSDVDVYPPESDIAYTTVSLRHSTIASYLQAMIDDDIEIVEDDVVLGDRSESENRQFNLQLMDTSKQDAIRVALVALGYDVPITISGIVVVGVVEDSAADGVLEVGDTILSIDGETLGVASDVARIMDPKKPGDVVTLEVEPPDRAATRSVEVTLVAAGDEPERGIIGIQLQPRDPNYEYPFDIDIDSGNVGGPSAGLAFSLGVIDVLTPGELTGGLRVAVTGTIDRNGNVGNVGGVVQKTAVVTGAGYDVFLVPRDEVDEVRARAGDNLQVIPVGTLAEALDALASLGGSGFETAAAPG